MKRFEEFLGTNDVRKTTPDKGLAHALHRDAQNRVEVILKLPITAQSATIIFEQVYEALRECADALLTLDGFKSYSHVASIAFLSNYAEISKTELHKLDNAREKRNLAKYYGKPVTQDETKDLIALYRELKPTLDALFKQAVGKP